LLPTCRYLGLLGLLKLGRMYRVVLMYNNMSYNLNFGLLALTLFRNATVSLSVISGGVPSGHDWWLGGWLGATRRVVAGLGKPG
jgi:hypothetical protein